MAGAGYKLFNTGDVLTAQQVNEYLQQQTVMVFANSTARTTALSGVLAEGMMSYLQDQNKVYVYDGSAWVETGASFPSQSGNSGKYLTTDGTNPSWATVSAIPPMLPEVSTYLYRMATNGVSYYDSIPSTTTYFNPIFLTAGTYDRLTIRTGAAYDAGGTHTVRLGIYNNSSANLPSTVALDAGTVSISAANTTYSITISQTLTTGYYWLACNIQSGTAGYTRSLTTSGSPFNGWSNVYLPTNAITNNSTLPYQSSVSGAFGTASISGWESYPNVPLVAIRRS